MDPLVECLVEEPAWEGFGLARLGEGAARAALSELGLPAGGFLISLLGCNDSRIAELNADFRGKPRPTNVLSWPSAERGAERPGERPALPAPGDASDPEELGDIAIAWGTCQREAGEQGKSMQDHVTHLVVHAVLHLLGYDHEEDADAALMEATEVGALARLGVENPY